MIKDISSLVSIGEKIEVEIEKGDSSYLRLKSEIINLLNDDTIIIASPIYQGKIYTLIHGSKTNIVINKKNTGKFYFAVELIKKERKDNLFLLHMKKISDISKLQRRSYYRLKLLINIKIEIIQDGNIQKSFDCITKDISGGGLRFVSKEKIELENTVNCIIPLEREKVSVTGEVIRCKSIPDSMNNYDIGIKFISIDSNVRSKIISFVFNQQRKLIKKGMI